MKAKFNKVLGQRVLAYLGDGLVLYLAIFAVQGVILQLGLNPIVKLMDQGETPAGWQLHLWVFMVVSVPLWVYYTLTQSSTHQATWVMRWFNLQTISLNGALVTKTQALLRSVVMLLPFELNHTALFGTIPDPAGYLTIALITLTWVLIGGNFAAILFTEKQQTLHDWIAGTTIVMKTDVSV